MLFPSHADLWRTLSPALFVFLWASGFVAAKLGIPYAEPFTFLLFRFAVVTLLMLAIALATRAPWPADWRLAGHIAVVGMLLHATYLGGTYAAIALGMPAGLAALIVGLQPLLTAAAARPFLGERVTLRQWTGLVLGFAGVLLVLWEKLAFDLAGAASLAFSLLSLLGITAATLYQKRFGTGMDLRTGGVIQYGAAMLPVLPVALIFESNRIVWASEFLLALGWLVFALSLGSFALLMWLIRRGAAARVASLFYLVPPVAALMAWLVFGETMGPAALLGMAVAVLGVALVVR